MPRYVPCSPLERPLMSGDRLCSQISHLDVKACIPINFRFARHSTPLLLSRETEALNLLSKSSLAPRIQLDMTYHVPLHATANVTCQLDAVVFQARA